MRYGDPTRHGVPVTARGFEEVIVKPTVRPALTLLQGGAEDAASAGARATATRLLAKAAPKIAKGAGAAAFVVGTYADWVINPSRSIAGDEWEYAPLGSWNEWRRFWNWPNDRSSRLGCCRVGQ